MKTKFLISILVLAMSMLSCGKAAFVSAPGGSVPLRKDLEKDVYGSYIILLTTDKTEYRGELIGMRNDTIVVLSSDLNLILRDKVSSARAIVHLPNNYRVGGGVLMGLSGLVIFQTPGYGGSAFTLGLFGMLFNGIGLASAQGTEDMKINYFDWSEGWEKVMIYSRFPKGIPSVVKIQELRPREIKVN